MRMLRRAVFVGQWAAAIGLPLVAVVFLVLTVGDIPSGLAMVACLPSMLLLAIPPICGRAIGRMRLAEQITGSYAALTVAVWACYLRFWFSWIETGQELSGPATVTTLVVVLAAVWLCQLAAALCARRRTSPVRRHKGDTVAS